MSAPAKSRAILRPRSTERSGRASPGGVPASPGRKGIARRVYLRGVTYPLRQRDFCVNSE